MNCKHNDESASLSINFPEGNISVEKTGRDAKLYVQNINAFTHLYTQ